MPSKGDVFVPFGSQIGTLQAGVLATADIANLAVTTAKLAADAVTGAKIADDAIDSEHYVDGSIDLAHLSADCVDGTKIADDAIDSEHYADGSVDEVHLAAASLTGLVAATVADSNVIGGIPVLFRIPVAAGAAAAVDVVMTHKVRVIDVWAVHTGGAGEASDTLTVSNTADAITDAMDWSGADNTIVRASTIDDAHHEIAAAGTLRVTPVDNDAGSDVGAGIVYVLALRVA